MTALALRSADTARDSSVQRANAPTRPKRPNEARPGLGNQAHLRKFTPAPTGLQAKLAIGAVNDPLEREADVAADTVMRMADPALSLSGAWPTLRRKWAACEEDERSSIQREAGGDGADQAEAPETVSAVLRQTGRPLDPATNDFMALRFGADFSDVRVHDGAEAAASARAISAHAYTVGHHLVFGQSRYEPSSENGRRLIAHELAHTIQQGAGAPIVRNQARLRKLSAGPTRVQRDSPDPPLKEAKAEDATEAFGGGVKEVAKRAADDPIIKDAGEKAVKSFAEPIWRGLTTADKAAIIVGGGTIAGATLAGALASTSGRQGLSGVPLGKPLSLIPYAIISDFSYDLPKLKTDPLLLHFSLKADDYLDLLRSRYSFLPKMELSFDMTVSRSSDGKWSQPSGIAKFSPLPGVSIAGGYGLATDFLTAGAPAEGGPVNLSKEYPTPATPAPRSGEAVFVSVDLAQVDKLKGVFGRIVGNSGGTK